MRFAKLTEGFPRFAPNPILTGGDYVGNPQDAAYLAAGYKPVEYTDPVGDVPEGYCWEPGWEETDAAIVQTWHPAELPPEPAAEADYESALSRLGVEV